MKERQFGDAGARLVLEECLAGPEVSFFGLCDGVRAIPLRSAQDHKRIFDNDEGPNTGGMGAFAPSPLITALIEQRVLDEIVRPVLNGMKAEGHPFRGFLYVGLMLFKGTATRSAEDIAQTIDSIGGQMDAFTAKEYASYYIKVLDEHLPLAVDVLSDIVMNPAFKAEDIEREKKVVLEEIKMVEDTPDDLVHELFTESFWSNHPLGRPILGTKETVEGLNQTALRKYFSTAYTAPNLIVAAVGNVTHERVKELVGKAFEKLPTTTEPISEAPPRVIPRITIRNKELEQSHVCLGAPSYQQDHVDRYSSYVMNKIGRAHV